MIDDSVLERDRRAPHDRTVLSDVGLSRWHDRTIEIHAAIAHARRNEYTIDVPLSPYIIRPIGQCDRAIFRIAITRDGRIRRGALHAGLATSALRRSRKSKIPCLRYTRREAERWLMPASPRLSYLTYLGSRAACTAAYKSRPHPLPTLRFPDGYLSAIFFVRRAHGRRWLCLRETVPDTQIRLKIIRDSRRRH